ncbi:MAG: hypothetical protein JXB50_16455, partial [Spirochaetes bacterium]|nr:hypothetical protein [Spirochaetota bacterium]
GHRPRFTDKYAVAISTTCGVGLKEALKYLTFSTAGAWGFKLAGTLGAQTHPFYLNKKSGKKLDDNIETLAKKFYNVLSQKELPPLKLGELMRYISMMKISNYSKEFFPADYKFYHENKEPGTKYYHKSAKTGFFTKTVAKILGLMIDRSMRKISRRSDMNQKFLEW